MLLLIVKCYQHIAIPDMIFAPLLFCFRVYCRFLSPLDLEFDTFLQ